MTEPRFLDAGECALVVEFGSVIEPALTGRVHALDAALSAAPPEGLIELVPTYRSLMIHYDPLVLSRDGLIAAVREGLGRPVPGAGGSRHWRLPSCHELALAEDLPHIARETGLSQDDVTARFLGATYRVAMYGFAPGWAYLSGLPAELTLPRRSTPRPEIPGGSLIVAGGQAIVAGGAMPSGWHILGRSPVRMFDPARTPALVVAPGDRITFVPVGLSGFRELEARAARGESLMERIG
jgi:KipI family sensor histidine kinase inhibitor